MCKTRSQTENIVIKKEEEDRKPMLGADSITVTRSKITKRRSPIMSNISLPALQVKVEEDTDAKSLLQSSSKYSKYGPNPKISQEQINQLIHHIVNDNMSVIKAARKVNISPCRAYYYYNLYKNDPKKKIPSTQSRYIHSRTYYTQEQIGNLIKYITQDKMTIKEASAKEDIPYSSSHRYYNIYLKDPNHNIPVPQLHQYYTQDQKNEFIGYIINDKMNITTASKKAKMNYSTGYYHYREYFKEQNPDIATPSHIVTHKCYSQEQIKEVINYIVDDKMSIRAGSRKANMHPNIARKYYQQYLKDNDIKLPVARKTYTQDDINKFIGYIIDDKMNIKAASKKANIPYSTAKGFFRQYTKKHNLDISTSKYKQDEINQLIGYIVVDNMSIKAASKKANMSVDTGRKYYRQYLNDNNLDVPIQNVITQEQKSELIRYIVDDKMSVTAASKKANMSLTSGHVYYHRYLNN